MSCINTIMCVSNLTSRFTETTGAWTQHLMSTTDQQAEANWLQSPYWPTDSESTSRNNHLSTGQAIEILLDYFLCDHIQTTRRLIEQQDHWRVRKRPRERETLPLPAG